jgi:hypothetical protein
VLDNALPSQSFFYDKSTKCLSGVERFIFQRSILICSVICTCEASNAKASFNEFKRQITKQSDQNYKLPLSQK